MPTKKHRYTTGLIVIAAALGGLLYGYDLGVIGPALLYISKDIPMDTWHTGILGGCVFGGGALATLCAGYFSNRYGRRTMLWASSVIFCAGVLASAASHHFLTLLLGRLIQGIGVGIVTIVTPLYLSESTPPHIRGRAVCVFQFLLTFSIMLAYAVGLIFRGGENWRGMFLTALVPGVLMMIGAFSIPRSPRWLAMKNKLQAAKTALLKTHDPETAEREFQQIIEGQHGRDHSKQPILSRHLLWIPLSIVFLSAIFNQLTGVNALLQYAPIVFKRAGVSTESMAIVSSTVVTAINCAITLVALILVDKVGRKKLLLTGNIGIIIALICNASLFAFLPESALRGQLFLAGLAIFVFSFSIGPGVVIWLVISELLPDHIRSTGMSVALFLNSLTSFFLASSYLRLSEWIGFSGLFIACSIFTLLYTALTLFFIPETKGQSLSDIAHYFENRFNQQREA